MLARRRALRSLAAAALLSAGGAVGLLAAAPAGAAVSNCAGTYPASSVCSVALTSTIVTPGGSDQFTASAGTFDSGESLTATISEPDPLDQTVGTYTAAADGSASGSFTVPASDPAGSYTFTLVGATSGSSVSASFTVGAVTPVSTSTATSSGSGLPFTGADVVPLVVAAIVLIFVGAGLQVGVRRQRRRFARS